jgi:hypothetical protein
LAFLAAPRFASCQLACVQLPSTVASRCMAVEKRCALGSV